MIPTLDHSSPERLQETCEGYLGSRTGRYEWRCQRYDAALQAMGMIFGEALKHNGGYGPVDTSTLTVCDVGAGWTEFGRRMFEIGWQSRYWPVDGGLDGTDLNHWVPQRSADFFVALEILEHLHDVYRIVHAMKERAQLGIVISTPNPRTTDVIGMDPTHVRSISMEMLQAYGFTVEERSFYGKNNDSLLAVWRKR